MPAGCSLTWVRPHILTNSPPVPTYLPPAAQTLVLPLHRAAECWSRGPAVLVSSKVFLHHLCDFQFYTCACTSECAKCSYIYYFIGDPSLAALGAVQGRDKALYYRRGKGSPRRQVPCPRSHAQLRNVGARSWSWVGLSHLTKQSCPFRNEDSQGAVMSKVLSRTLQNTLAQWVKTPPASKRHRRHEFSPLGWEDPLDEEMATYSWSLAWRIPWTEEPGRLQSMGSQRVKHDWGPKHNSINHIFLSVLCTNPGTSLKTAKPLSTKSPVLHSENSWCDENTQMLKSEEVSVSLSPWKDGSSSEPCGPVDNEGDDNTYLPSYENERGHHTQISLTVSYTTVTHDNEYS